MKRIKKNVNERGELTPSKERGERWKHLIVDFYLKGLSLQQIREAAKEKTGHAFGFETVKKYIGEQVAAWKTEQAEMMNDYKTAELEKINRLEATYWEAWERSIETNKRKTRVKTKEKGEDLRISRINENEERGKGDPRYLQGVQWCIDKRMELIGPAVPQTAIQVNNQVNQVTNNQTTIIRRVVFKSRETTAAPQTIVIENDEK